MYFQNDQEWIMALSVISALLLALSLGASLLAALKSHQVTQFQDQLFKAERKIDQLEKRVFNVLNAVPIAIIETDATGRFIFANRAAQHLLGRKEAELIVLRFHSASWGITYPDGRPIPQDLLPVARALRGQTVKGFQHLIAQADTGEKILVSVTSMPMMNAAGEITGSSSALVELETQEGTGVGDVTGLWRGSWFTQAPIPFFGLDKGGMILDLNQAACEALNLRREQAIGQILIDRFIIPDDQGPAHSYCQSSLNDEHTSEAIDIVLRLKTLDGRTFSYLVSAWAVRASSVGDHGLTLMALPHDGQLITQEHAAPSLENINSDNNSHDRLVEFTQNESLRAGLGIGQWVYDPASDSIIEDEGMRALIGRETDGGPTRIHPADQGRTDQSFIALLSGEIDDFSLTITIEPATNHPDQSSKTMILTGHVTNNGPRIPYGLAFDKDKIENALKLNQSPSPLLIRNDLDAVDQEYERMNMTIQSLNETLAEVRSREEDLKVKLAELTLNQTPIETIHNGSKDNTELLRQALAESQDALAAEIYSWKEAYIDHKQNQKLHTIIEENQEFKAHKRRLEIEIYELKSRLAALAREQGNIKDQEALEAQKHEAERALQAVRREAMDLSLSLQKEIEILKSNINDQKQDYESRLSKLHEALTIESDEHNQTKQNLKSFETAPAPEPVIIVRPDPSQSERIALLELELIKAQKDHEDAQNEILILSKIPEPIIEQRPDPSQIQRIAELEFELFKSKTAQDDLQKRLLDLASALEIAQKTPIIDMGPLEARMLSLESELQLSQAQQSRLQTTVEQLTLALNQAQRFETIGRLTADVAVDFAQMLSVVNHALELMNNQSDNAEQVRKLSEAALAAGKRGERLTRQIQAFNQSDW